MFVHPLFELEFRWDPTLPRFYRFMMLYFRLVLNMMICYFGFKGSPTFSDLGSNIGVRIILTIVYSLVLSLLFLPLPEFMLSMFRFKYYLSFERQEKEESEDICNLFHG